MKPPPTLLPIFFSLFIIFTSGADIPPGSTLSASNPNHTWNSPNNAFSLRFISAGSAFFAAVTYGGVPVWIAGGDGGAADSSASLQFLSDGSLRLVNGSASAVVWESSTAGRGVSAAALDNSGNFVLRNGNVSVWSTFDNPTDTILPSQNFTINRELRSGLYSFSLLRSGNLTLKWNNSIVYWNLGLNSSINNINLTSPILQLQPIGILLISDPSLKSAVILSYSSDYAEGTDVLRFLRLDSDGNLRIYSSAMDSGTSTERWSAVSDQCQVFGYCGNLGICSYNDSNPVCGCPSRNFEPIDPKDSRRGVLNCLVSGSCIASTSLSDGTGLCYLKFPNFVSGYQSAALPSTSYVKAPSWVWSWWREVCGGGVVEIAPSLGGLAAQYALLEYASGAPVQFSYKELQRATKGFKEKLGAGGFGAVL
ncbi:lectin protein kinase family protein [Actinidia rufa]|uniref:non-specific serine/threonine protein kinase n=1 Tax=Actinidia rufa TaxID=165716 RepID=A0A7J0GFN5_9ERIC|nr:lectin protein kinase family protein [Actinidia rufa]